MTVVAFLQSFREAPVARSTLVALVGVVLGVFLGRHLLDGGGDSLGLGRCIVVVGGVSLSILALFGKLDGPLLFLTLDTGGADVRPAGEGVLVAELLARVAGGDLLGQLLHTRVHRPHRDSHHHPTVLALLGELLALRHVVLHLRPQEPPLAEGTRRVAIPTIRLMLDQLLAAHHNSLATLGLKFAAQQQRLAQLQDLRLGRLVDVGVRRAFAGMGLRPADGADQLPTFDALKDCPRNQLAVVTLRLLFQLRDLNLRDAGQAHPHDLGRLDVQRAVWVRLFRQLFHCCDVLD